MSLNSKIYSALTMLKTSFNYLNLSISVFKNLRMQIEFCNPVYCSDTITVGYLIVLLIPGSIHKAGSGA